ncbi:ribosome maturation factor RimP, partial [Neisseria gonorrhoeae]
MSTIFTISHYKPPLHPLFSVPKTQNKSTLSFLRKSGYNHADFSTFDEKWPRG